MSHTYKPTYVLTIKGSGGEVEYHRTDDVEAATKNAAARGFKVVSTELSKRAATPDIRKAYSSENAKVNAILKKAAKNPASVTPDEIETVRKFSQNYSQAMAEFNAQPGQATKDNLATSDYWKVIDAEDASETDASLQQMLEDAQTSGNATRVQMLKARMRARAEARGRADARSKSAMMDYSVGPHGVSSANLGDTTGPAFDPNVVAGQGAYESLQVTGKEPFAESYDQSDIDSFNEWASGLDPEAVIRQGLSKSELFYRFQQAQKPQVLSFGESITPLGYARTMTQEPGSDRIAPKGGQ
jgi:hypothetical protein